ncbi:MAG: hypothetical protein WBQ72_05905 [Terriglobales bacterium]
MDLFLDFLQRIAWGAGVVLVLLVVVRLGMPRRSAIVIRRKSD